MTANQTDEAITPEKIRSDLQEFLTTKIEVAPKVEKDLFSSGLITSLFALELVTYIEKTYDIEINGADLKLNNFRTINAMIDLVCRIRARENVE
jgi:methoxymalonate biosynthesis acyl carrier protein